MKTRSRYKQKPYYCILYVVASKGINDQPDDGPEKGQNM